MEFYTLEQAHRRFGDCVIIDQCKGEYFFLKGSYSWEMHAFKIRSGKLRVEKFNVFNSTCDYDHEALFKRIARRGWQNAVLCKHSEDKYIKRDDFKKVLAFYYYKG